MPLQVLHHAIGTVERAFFALREVTEVDSHKLFFN